MKISALLIARNEEKKIKKCLQSLSFADEVIVVLDRTTDQTMSIAKKFYNKIYQGKWEYEGDRRNFGIEKCSNDWILENDDNIININFTGIFENVPQVITDISATNNYNLQFDKLVYNLNKDGFKFSLKISNDLNIDNFNVANNTNFVDVNDLIKNTFTLNYILIG